MVINEALQVPRVTRFNILHCQQKLKGHVTTIFCHNEDLHIVHQISKSSAFLFLTYLFYAYLISSVHGPSP